MFIVYGAFCAGDGAAVSTLWFAFVNDGNVPVPSSGLEWITSGQ